MLLAEVKLVTGPKRNRKQHRAEFLMQIRASAPQALKDIWAESKRKGLDKLTTRQIDAIITEARQEQEFRKNTKQPAK